MGDGDDACVLRCDANESEGHSAPGLTFSGNVGRLLFASLQVLRFRDCCFGTNVAEDCFNRRFGDIEFVVLSAGGYLVRLRDLRRSEGACRSFFDVFRRWLVVNHRVEFALRYIGSGAFYLG